MALTQAQIDQARQAVGLDSAPASSGSSTPTDWSSRMDGLRSIAAQTKDPRAGLTPGPDQPEPQKPGFFQQPQIGPTFPSKPTDSPVTAAAKTVGNIPSSTANLAIGAAGYINPVNTVKTAANLGTAMGEAGAEAAVDPRGKDQILKDTITGLPAAAYHTLVPKFFQQLFAGDTKGAQETITNDPTGQLVPVLLGGKALAEKAGYGAQFDHVMTKVASPVTEPVATVKAALPAVKAAGEAVRLTKPKTASLGPTASVQDVAGNQNTWDMIKPKNPDPENLQPQGTFGKVSQIPTKQDQAMIDSAHPYVSGAKDVFEARTNLKNGIAEEAGRVRAALKNSPGTWNQNTLKGLLNKIDVDAPEFINVKSDVTNFNKFNNFKAAIVKLADTTAKIDEGRLDLRQGFDKVVNKAFPKLWDKNSEMLPVVRAFRKTLNDFTASGLKGGKLADGTPLEAALLKQSHLYDAIDNINAKLPKEGDYSNAATRLAAKHPIATDVIKKLPVVGPVLKHVPSK